MSGERETESPITEDLGHPVFEHARAVIFVYKGVLRKQYDPLN